LEGRRKTMDPNKLLADIRELVETYERYGLTTDEVDDLQESIANLDSWFYRRFWK
jgi:hypothetical protein